MTITFTSLAKPVALYTLHLSTNYSGAHCAVYRHRSPGAPAKVVTMTSATTQTEALRLARREVRAARKCGGLKALSR